MKRIAKFYSLLVFVTILACRGEKSTVVTQEDYRYESPLVIYNELFKELNASHLFKDQKSIADAIPKHHPEVIMDAYDKAKSADDFDLLTFFHDHFELTKSPTDDFETDTSLSTADHIKRLWPYLQRGAGVEEDEIAGSSLIPLPNPYIVPGGRFNEIYYWDSYFTMIGLRESGRIQEIENMVDNFSYLIGKFGFIPNGNRSYFLGRSQPPFYSLMVTLLAEEKGDGIYKKYLPQLEKEYAFWMHDKVDERIVKLDGQVVLNRYHDNHPQPREEMYQHDLEAFEKTNRNEEDFYQAIRSACESGWDFSSRWFTDGNEFTSIETNDILPVDLNSLLYHLEKTLGKAYLTIGDEPNAEKFVELSDKRAAQIRNVFWSEDLQYFTDYNFEKKELTNKLSLAGMYPLFFGIATDEQAQRCAKMIKKEFLRDGGVVSTPYHSGQQWDAPNGWAPLQWITVNGLMNYEEEELAKTIATRWLSLNDAVFKRTGKMMEKYNVEDITLLAGGGEYDGQSGFGWTNGVYLGLADMFDE